MFSISCSDICKQNHRLVQDVLYLLLRHLQTEPSLCPGCSLSPAQTSANRTIVLSRMFSISCSDICKQNHRLVQDVLYLPLRHLQTEPSSCPGCSLSPAQTSANRTVVLSRMFSISRSDICKQNHRLVQDVLYLLLRHLQTKPSSCPGCSLSPAQTSANRTIVLSRMFSISCSDICKQNHRLVQDVLYLLLRHLQTEPSSCPGCSLSPALTSANRTIVLSRMFSISCSDICKQNHRLVQDVLYRSCSDICKQNHRLVQDVLCSLSPAQDVRLLKKLRNYTTKIKKNIRKQFCVFYCLLNQNHRTSLTPFTPFFSLSSMKRDRYSGDFRLRLIKYSKSEEIICLKRRSSLNDSCRK